MPRQREEVSEGIPAYQEMRPTVGLLAADEIRESTDDDEHDECRGRVQRQG